LQKINCTEKQNLDHLTQLNAILNLEHENGGEEDQRKKKKEKKKKA